jgi:flagellar M-ring protein FliF
MLTVWNALELRRKIIVVAATLGVFAAVFGLTRIAAAPSMSLLYAGLEGPQAGEMITALDQRGQRYEVRGDAIYVESSARDETRMALAAQGMPANSSSGYELLDGLTGFGTTAQMFDAAYWRAPSWPAPIFAWRACTSRRAARRHFAGINSRRPR